MRFAVIALAFGLLLAATSEAAAPFVIDETRHLPSEVRGRVTRQLAALLRDADIEVVVLLVPALGGTPIADYAEARFETFRVGVRTRGNRGALLVVAAREKRVRLAVAYDLEPIFPDAFVGYVERAQLRPYVQAGRLADGIEATVELLARRALEGIAGRAYDPATVTIRAPDAPRTGGAGAEIPLSGPPSSGPLRSDPAVRAAFGPQVTPEAAWLRFLELNRRRIKDPELELYDAAAQAHLRDRPQTDAGQDHIARLYTGRRYEVRVRGNRAVVVFPDDPRHLLAPWFFHRTEAGWRLDGRMYPGIIRYNHLNQWRFVRRDHPYAFAFTDYTIDTNGFATYRGATQ